MRYPMALAGAVIVAASALIVHTHAQLRVAPVGERPDSQALELLLRKLSSTGTFMETDAHPDDEDNSLLALLGWSQGMRTVLVTATRGDGGQNEIGPELGQSLSVLRTEELLAAHRLDGAEQYFTRAVDFGYSFSIEESIGKWGHDEIVGDLVRHIRTVRPDVIAGFLCGGQAGGLHHQASAKLTLEAFRAAGDPAKYPEQIKAGLHPWQAVRYFCTDENSFAPNRPPLTPDEVATTVSGFDPALGRTCAALGVEARSMHRCQGTSQLLALPGQTQSRTYRLQDHTDSQSQAGQTLFDGIDASLQGLARFTGGHSAPALTTALRAIQQTVIDARAAAASRGNAAAVTSLVGGLRAIRALRADLPKLLGGDAADASYEIELRLAQKERQFQDALTAAAAVGLDALADDGVVTPGQPVTVTVYAAAGFSAPAVQLRGVTLSGFDGQLPECVGALTAQVTCKTTARIPPGTHLSTPYWTPRTDAARYDFEPDVPFGVPFRPSPFHATFELTIGGERVTVDRVVQFRYSDLVAGEKRSELNVSPAFDVTVDPEIAVFPIGGADLPPKGGSYGEGDRSVPSADRSVASADPSVASADPSVASAFRRKTITVTIGNNQKGAANATVTLKAPAGWEVDPASAPVTFARENEETTARFTLSAPSGATAGEFRATVVVTSDAGAASDLGYRVVEYPHIHRRHVVLPAAVRLKTLDVAIAPGLKVGYIMGVGDTVPEAIAQLGASVTMIDPAMLASGDLSQFDDIVVGVRAYDRRADLRANNQRLIAYAEKGGTVIVQYQRAEFNLAQYGPYPAKTSDARITDETAPMEILVPDDPIFTTPNRLGPETWQGWVQERGTYFLGEKDPRYTDLLRSQDPFPYNAGPKTGILVEARVGSGRWIYTGLSLWRQVAAGTDGAYRLLANLLSLGKSGRSARAAASERVGGFGGAKPPGKG
jgi:LmbE family N-acetylglucosaminyl deacetylase